MEAVEGFAGLLATVHRNVRRRRKTITGFWEKSGDGEAWEHDFDLAYTKQSETTTEKETK